MLYVSDAEKFGLM